MATNSFDLDSLLKQIPLRDLATKLGVDEDTAQDAVSKAIPGILAGLANNAQSEEGASALQAALQEHNRDVRSLADVDVEDGEKILGHALGGKKTEVVTAVSGGDTDLFSKLMPMLAPIVMAFLAKNMTQSSSSGSGGGIGDLLGSILGGGSSSGGGPLGGLGSILGGGSSNGSGGGIGSILGSIFGR